MPRLLAQANASSAPPSASAAYVEPKDVHPVEANWLPSQGGVFVQTMGNSESLHLVLGHSMVLATGSNLRRVYIGDPKVLQSFSSGPKEEVITAKTCGVSTLILWDISGRRRVYTVFADLDTDGILKVLEDAVPGAKLSIATNGNRMVLAGTVPSDTAADTISKLAQVYSKDLVDSVKVMPLHGKQIQLKLRIIEVDRSRLEQYGVNFFALGGSTLAGTTTGQFASTAIPASASSGTSVSVSDPLNLLLYSSKLNAGITVRDLEQKQILQILAEPTLTTLSGLPARFLSGGEFPLPVVQGGTGNSTAITIIFKPYGVKVDFTPTANADGSIRLKVAPEVSALDYTNSVTVSGFVIPALSTRRAETEVELADGQSFVITGLLDNRTTDNLARTPGIADIPILGQLFRSKGLTHSVVELVVLVTASIVDPLSAASVTELPKMAVPNLDRDQFDRDVRSKKTGRSTEPDPSPSAPGSSTITPSINPATNPLTTPPTTPVGNASGTPSAASSITSSTTSSATPPVSTPPPARLTTSSSAATPRAKLPTDVTPSFYQEQP